MSGINKVILVGHIGKEPNLRILPDQVSVLSFPFATSETIIRDGLKIEQTEWHNIVIWRALAESAARLLKKGMLVYLEGRLRTRCFEKDCLKKYTTEIIVDHYTMLGRRSDFAEEMASI
jgi:single-strand DNA-binding protein